MLYVKASVFNIISAFTWLRKHWEDNISHDLINFKKFCIVYQQCNLNPIINKTLFSFWTVLIKSIHKNELRTSWQHRSNTFPTKRATFLCGNDILATTFSFSVRAPIVSTPSTRRIRPLTIDKWQENSPIFVEDDIVYWAARFGCATNATFSLRIESHFSVLF